MCAAARRPQNLWPSSAGTAWGPYFLSLSGAPVSKVHALSRLRAQGPVTFFGDALADWHAARDAGAAFIAVQPSAALRPHVGAWLDDYTDLGRVRQLLAQARPPGH